MSKLNSSITKRIKYLQGPDLLDPLNNDIDYRKLILWLENRIIRCYKIEEREALSNVEIPLGKWKPCFKNYMEDLEAEGSVIESLNGKGWQGVCLQYLLDVAVEYFHEDKMASEKMEGMDVDNESTNTQASQGHISGPWENFDQKSENFTKNIKNLAEFLKIPKQSIQLASDEKILEACVNVLENRFSNRNLINDKLAFKHENLSEISCGFDTGDLWVNEIGKILRLLLGGWVLFGKRKCKPETETGNVNRKQKPERKPETETGSGNRKRKPEMEIETGKRKPKIGNRTLTKIKDQTLFLFVF